MSERIKNLPLSMRPYEKFKDDGPEKLQDDELLAIILRSGSRGYSSLSLAREILKQTRSYEGLLGLLHISIQDLMKIPGIGEVKAIQLKCIGELSRRIAKKSSGIRLCFNDPDSIASYYMEDLRHREQECLICMMLDTKNHLVGEVLISQGTVNASIVSPRDIFLQALSYHAVFIILIHNHPSGNPRPSREDILVTKKIYTAGKLLEIELLDHIIIGDLCHCSMRREGLLPDC